MTAEATPAQDEHCRGDADGDSAVQGESPRERNDAVSTCGEHEEDEAADAAEGKRRRGRQVAVTGGERARGQRGEQLRERRRNDPRQRVGGDGGRLVREPAGDQLTPEA